jgi:hypothetical protein
VETGQKVDGGIVVEEGSNRTTNGWSLWMCDYCVDCFDVVHASVVVAVVGGYIYGAFRECIPCIPWESLKVLHRIGTRRQFRLRLRLTMKGEKVIVSLDSTAVTEREENQSKRSLHTAPITGGRGEG